MKTFGSLLLIMLINFSCSDDTAIIDDVSNDPTSKLLPMPKGIISTGTKGIPLDQRIINVSSI